MSQSSVTELSDPVDETRDHVHGSTGAPVTLVEYGDYECKYCGRAYPIVKDLQDRFEDQLRFVFRNFPLRNLHPHAEQAAEAAEGANAQHEFWPMHDTLFENQDALNDEDLIGYADTLDLDVDRFERELKENRHRERVETDLLSGARSGVRGTPTFFINGQQFDGNWTEVDTFANELQEYI